MREYKCFLAGSQPRLRAEASAVRSMRAPLLFQGCPLSSSSIVCMTALGVTSRSRKRAKARKGLERTVLLFCPETRRMADGTLAKWQVGVYRKR